MFLNLDAGTCRRVRLCDMRLTRQELRSSALAKKNRGGSGYLAESTSMYYYSHCDWTKGLRQHQAPQSEIIPLGLFSGHLYSRAADAMDKLQPIPETMAASRT